MPIVKLTANSDLLCEYGQGMMPKGANVEIALNYGEALFPDKIQEAFLRKYGKCPTLGNCACGMTKEELK